MDVWDHDGTLVRTVPNDGEGFIFPGDILDIMYDEAIDSYQAAGSSVDIRTLRILADAAFEQIEEV